MLTNPELNLEKCWVQKPRVEPGKRSGMNLVTFCGFKTGGFKPGKTLGLTWKDSISGSL